MSGVCITSMATAGFGWRSFTRRDRTMASRVEPRSLSLSGCRGPPTGGEPVVVVVWGGGGGLSAEATGTFCEKCIFAANSAHALHLPKLRD